MSNEQTTGDQPEKKPDVQVLPVRVIPEDTEEVPGPILAAMEFLRFCSYIEAPGDAEEYKSRARDLRPEEEAVYLTALRMIDAYFKIRIVAWEDDLSDVIEATTGNDLGQAVHDEE